VKLPCPHCQLPGITLSSKLLLGAMIWTRGSGARRTRCSQAVRLRRAAAHVQFALYVLFLAVLGWSSVDASRLALVYTCGGIILAIGRLAPLERLNL
jgi:hypothetical protein